MHSLECFIAIINCNLYIKIRKTVRPIHLWGIINMVMTSLTTSHKLLNTSRALKQFHSYLLNLFSISTCVFLGCAHSHWPDSAAVPSWVWRSPGFGRIWDWFPISLLVPIQPSITRTDITPSHTFPHDVHPKIKQTISSLENCLLPPFFLFIFLPHNITLTEVRDKMF